MSFATCASAVAANSTRLICFSTERRDRSGDEDDTIHNFAIWEAVVRRLALVRSERAAAADSGDVGCAGSFAGGSA
jgi:hypothetical protein